MLLSSINYLMLSGLLYLAHAAPLAGFSSFFTVLFVNRKHGDDTKPTIRSRLYFLLSIPAIVLLFAYVTIPILSKIEIGVPVTNSVPDLSFFFTSFAIGIVSAIVMLRTGVQFFASAKNKLTKTSALERNNKTDVRDLSKSIPACALKFDPLKFMIKKKGVFLGLNEKSEPTYISFGSGTSAPHLDVIGTTGAGKGIALGVLASQFLERGEAVFFCDPKNDEYAPSVMYAAAQRTGKPYHYINLNRPHGAQFNLVEGVTEEECFELLQAGFGLTEKGDASDFYGIADRREAGIVAKLIARDPPVSD